MASSGTFLLSVLLSVMVMREKVKVQLSNALQQSCKKVSSKGDSSSCYRKNVSVNACTIRAQRFNDTCC